MDTDDILYTQLGNLGVESAGSVSDKGTKLECEELYVVTLEVLRLLYKRSGQAAKDSVDGTRAGVMLLPKKVPKSTSSRFSICENMAKELTNFGCDAHRGDYNFIMYPTVEGTKAMLKWLSDALMKATEDERQRELNEKANEEAAGAGEISTVVSSLRNLKSKVEANRSSTTTGANASIRRRRPAANVLRSSYKFHATPELTSVKEEERVTFVDAVTHEFKGQKNTRSLGMGLYNSVLQYNASAETHGPKFTQAMNRHLDVEAASTLGDLQFSTTSSSATNRKRNAAGGLSSSDEVTKSSAALFFNSGEGGLDPAEFQSRKSAEKEAQAAMAELEEKHRTAQERGKQQKEEVENLRNELKAAKKEYALRKAQIKALKSVKEDLDQQVAAVQEAQEGGTHAQRLEALSEREELLELMENSKQSLDEYQGRYDELSEQQKTARDDFLKKMAKVEAVRERLTEDLAAAGAGKDEVLRSLRGECKDLKKQVKEKGAEVEQLRAEYKSCPKDIDRSKYLRYICDMTNNLQRQQEEIDKVRKETQVIEGNVQKLEDEVKVIFDKLEKIVYDNASTGAKGGNDNFCKDGYKQIVELRGAYVKLVELIQDRGTLKKETHEAEEKSSKLRRTVAEYDLAQVEKDLDQINREYEKVQAYFAENPGQEEGL